ncbi:hypothetical protein K3495_g5703 [Podosphaera aphanis]|nr:hypothetical protein K3495_g5703 [Podosphaera aphanis]
MSRINAPDAMVIDPIDQFEDSCSRTHEKAPGGGRGATKAPHDIDTAISRYKQAIQGEDHPSRSYKSFIEEAIQIIDRLWKAKVHPPPNSKASQKDENPMMAQIL